MFSETMKTFGVGLITIGLVTAVGLHAAGLAQVATSGGQAGAGLLQVAENPAKPK